MMVIVKKLKLAPSVVLTLVKSVACRQFLHQPHHHSGMDHLALLDLKVTRVKLEILEDKVKEVIVVCKEH